MSRTFVKVSVIIPVYNTGKWLRECLDSVCGQPLADLEIICVNDGSTDNSLDVLKEYAKKDRRIKIVCQKNKGLSEARNTGVRESKGKYLLFLDSDDWIASEAITELTNKMETENLDYVSFKAFSYGEDEKSIKKAESENKKYFQRTLDEGTICSGIDFFIYLKNNGIYNATACTSMISRELFLDNDLWFIPNILHEDEAYTFAALMCAQRAGCVDEYFYHRRSRASSIMTEKVSFDNLYGTYRALLYVKDRIRELDVSEEQMGVVLGHIDYLENFCVRKYLACSEEEKVRINELNLEDRMNLEELVVYPASLMTEIRLLKKERTQLKKQCKQLIADNEKYKSNLKKAKNSNKRIKQSRTYQAGRVVTFIPRRARMILTKVKKK